MTETETKDHITVLPKEAIEALALKPEATVVDTTLGSGGHTGAILKALKGTGLCLSLDVDEVAVNQFIEKYQVAKNHRLASGNFRHLDAILKKHAIKEPDAILADLGWRMDQFADGGKGFSFQSDEPLIMTYGRPEDYPFTAKEIINDWDEAVLADIFYGYGGERYARRIAKAITEARKKAVIETTGQLATIINQALPTVYRRSKLNPATKSFQGLRMAVNDELSSLEALIKISVAHLRIGGRLAIITFNSTEDRLVKNAFRNYSQEQQALLITKKPITPTEEEVATNPRARSAKLRVLEKSNHPPADLNHQNPLPTPL